MSVDPPVVANEILTLEGGGIPGDVGPKGDKGDPGTVNNHEHPTMIKFKDAIFPTSPWSNKKLQLSTLDNALFRAESRWTAVATRHNATTDALLQTMTAASYFDGDYEAGLVIPAGEYIKVAIDFGSKFPAYPYGVVYLSHYYTHRTASAKLRINNNFEAQGIGWSETVFGVYEDSGASQFIRSATQSKYGMTHMEVLMYAPADKSAQVVQIDLMLNRPGTANEMPYVDKFRPNTLYSNLNFATAVTGPVLRSPDGSRWRLTVSNAGVVGATKL